MQLAVVLSLNALVFKEQNMHGMRSFFNNNDVVMDNTEVSTVKDVQGIVIIRRLA